MFRNWLVGAGALTAMGALAPAAWATCGAPLKHTTGIELAPDRGGGSVARAAYDAANIVGMWAVHFNDSDNNQLDMGFVQWHSDGTEIMYSGGRYPSEGNVCMGVWQQTGPRRFVLNHWALSYDPSTNQLNAVVNIWQDVAVDSTNDNYSGVLMQTVYDPTSYKRLAQIKGSVTGKRITVSTSIPGKN
jgi:hypothetical protein